MANLPTQARVVIIGGGVAGASTAFHLAQLGWRDIVLLERKQLTCGTTWHAAGLAVRFKSTQTLTQLADYSLNLYDQLNSDGRATGIRRNGSLTVASSDIRREEVLRGISAARAFGLEVEEVDAQQVASLWPGIDASTVKLGAYLPADAQVSPVDLTMALIGAARDNGVSVYEHVAVTGFQHDGDRISSVQTEHGAIKTDLVVNCAGMWARDLGRLAGANIPLHACEHSYIVTEKIEGLRSDLPILRDLDGEAYYKEDAGKLLIGAFEGKGIPWGGQGIPEDFCFDELQPNFEQIAPVLEVSFERIPFLAETGIQTFFNGPESFTPDGNFMMGRTPEIDNLFVAAGFNSNGVGMGGGIGWAMAHWIADGIPPLDLSGQDIRRVLPFQADLNYLADRASEVLGKSYAVHWPHDQFKSQRNLRLSPLHAAMSDAGAYFEQAAGWERPGWFARAKSDRDLIHSFARPSWWDAVAEEHQAIRDQAGLMDLASFAQFEVTGTGALAALQWICTADIDVTPGRLVYTQWLNHRGGIEADLTVIRLAETQFLIVSGAGSASRNFVWLQRSLLNHPDVELSDVSEKYSLLSLQGPASRDILQQIADASIEAKDFAFGNVRSIPIVGENVLVARVSYVGELGFELYCPTEAVHPIYAALTRSGQPYGLRLFGMQAMNSCRIEKAFREWGHDISDQETPIEAGLMFASKMRTEIDFCGRKALREKFDLGLPTTRLVQVLLDDPEPLLFHNEPLYRDGCLSGIVTSAAYGHTLGGAVGMAYLRSAEGVTKDFVADGGYAVEIAGQQHPVKVSLRPFYDPTGKRMRS